MTEWKALIAEAKGDDWHSREVLLAADRVVRAARKHYRYATSSKQLIPCGCPICRAVEAMEREGR